MNKTNMLLFIVFVTFLVVFSYNHYIEFSILDDVSVNESMLDSVSKDYDSNATGIMVVLRKPPMGVIGGD